jgi:hypothetical protein
LNKYFSSLQCFLSHHLAFSVRSNFLP